MSEQQYQSYVVIKIINTNRNDLRDYECILNTWIRSRVIESNTIVCGYPPVGRLLALLDIFQNKPLDRKWPILSGEVVYDNDNLSAAIQFLGKINREKQQNVDDKTGEGSKEDVERTETNNASNVHNTNTITSSEKSKSLSKDKLLKQTNKDEKEMDPIILSTLNLIRAHMEDSDGEGGSITPSILHDSQIPDTAGKPANKTDNDQTDGVDTDNDESYNVERDNVETNNDETGNVESDNDETGNVESDNVETDNDETDNVETDNVETDNAETDNDETDNAEKDNVKAETSFVTHNNYKPNQKILRSSGSLDTNNSSSDDNDASPLENVKPKEKESVSEADKCYSYFCKFYTELQNSHQKSMSILNNAANYFKKIIAIHKEKTSSTISVCQQADDRRPKQKSKSRPIINSNSNLSWTLKYPKRKLGTIELMPGSKVYLSREGFRKCHEECKQSTKLATSLLHEIFSKKALKKCSFAGSKRGCIRRDKKILQPLHPKAREVLVKYVQCYAEKMNWPKRDRKSILISIKNKLQRMKH